MSIPFRSLYTGGFLLILFFAGAIPAALANPGAREPVIIPGKTFLPMRVLVRPQSNVYAEDNEQSRIVEENVATFQPFYVYTRPKTSTTGVQQEGWYEIGRDNRGEIYGWMKASDVMEWKQAMCMIFEHPTGRKPVMMFRDLAVLRDLTQEEDPDKRAKEVEALYKEWEKGEASPDYPVVAMEPKDAIAISDKFYLCPILESAPIEIEGLEARLLKIAAATKQGRGKQQLLEQQGSGKTGSFNPEAAISQETALDIVYVVDMTNSMQPYINATLETIVNIALEITKNSAVNSSIRFGLVGYRDSLDIPGIEFVTKNFTPELQDVKEFEKTLSSVSVCRVGSQNYEEDVFSGVHAAMKETKWNDNAMHMMILLGDAPSHEMGHKWNGTNQDANALRIYADDNRFSILAMHILDPQATQFHETTATQFKKLASNRGTEIPSYWPIPGGQMDEFQKVSQSVASAIVNRLQSVKSGNYAAPGSKPSPGGGQNTQQPAQGGAAAMAEAMFDAAFVDYLGKEKGVEAPRDIIAWVTNKDLIDPGIQSLDVRVLINKKQLDSLRTTLQEIMVAGKTSQIGGAKFFDRLQAVPTVAARSANNIKSAKNMSESGLIPEFMSGLPYTSKIMSMSNDQWASWSNDQQEEFLSEIDAKIQLYTTIHDTPEGWIQLSKEHSSDDFVYPLSLSSLP